MQFSIEVTSNDLTAAGRQVGSTVILFCLKNSETICFCYATLDKHQSQRLNQAIVVIFSNAFFSRCFFFIFVMLQPLFGDVATVVRGCCNYYPRMLQPLSGDVATVVLGCCNHCPGMLQLLS